MHPRARATSWLLLVWFACCALGSVATAGTNPFLTPRTSGAGCQPFVPATFYLENSNARSIAPGDFNGDGVLDFALITLDSSNAPTLTILLGKSDATFTAGQTYSIGTNSSGFPIAVGDLNGDGKLDVVAANGSDIVVFLGNGNGTFRTGKQTAIQGADGIATGDFNEDGKMDIAVTSFYDSANVKVMLGNGDGTFAAPVNYGVTLQPGSVVAADFNHDGHLDLAVANGFGHTVSVLFGNGKGTFGTKTDYAVKPEPFSITAADLNGDGSMDLATVGNGKVSVLLNRGDGTFLPADFYSTPAANAYSITAGPLESGAKPSLVAATTSGTYVLVNKGDGTFNAPQGYEPVSSGAVLTDIDGDGKADLAIVGGYRDEGGTYGVTIVPGEGNGLFATPRAEFVSFNLDAITLADFTGDGLLDMGTISSDGGPIGIFRGQGDGTFSLLKFYSGYANPPLRVKSVAAIAPGDFNRDGKVDLAIVAGAGPSDDQRLEILRGDGKGNFVLHGSYPVQGGFYPVQITPVDLNNDGNLDIVVSGSGAVDILLGNGDGTFQPATSYPSGSYARLIAGDFNKDGKVDFAVTNSTGSSLDVYLGKGDGTFKSPQSYPLKFAPSAIAAGDFNGDGKLDLAVGAGPGQDAAGNIQILLGVGDGTFQMGALLTGGYAPVTADFDGDGILDLAVITTQNLLQVFSGNGDGTFTAGAISSIGQDSTFFAIGDLNGDGSPDLVVPNDGGSEISVLLNQCGSK